MSFYHQIFVNWWAQWELSNGQTSAQWAWYGHEKAWRALCNRPNGPMLWLSWNPLGRRGPQFETRWAGKMYVIEAQWSFSSEPINWSFLAHWACHAMVSWGPLGLPYCSRWGQWACRLTECALFIWGPLLGLPYRIARGPMGLPVRTAWGLSQWACFGSHEAQWVCCIGSNKAQRACYIRSHRLRGHSNSTTRWRATGNQPDFLAWPSQRQDRPAAHIRYTQNRLQSQ